MPRLGLGLGLGLPSRVGGPTTRDRTVMLNYRLSLAVSATKETWDPSWLTGLLSWLDFTALANLTQGIDGTSPCTAAGQSLGRALDLSGNGGPWSALASGQREVVDVPQTGVSRGQLAPTTTANPNAWPLVGPQLTASGACTVAVSWRWRNLSGSGQDLVTIQTGTDECLDVFTTPSASYKPLSFKAKFGTAGGASLGVASNFDGGSATLDQARHTLVLVYKGGTNTSAAQYACSLDGYLSSNALSTVLTSSTFSRPNARTSMGARYDGTSATLAACAEIGRLAFWGADYSDATNLARINTWLAAGWLDYPYADRLASFGDSLSAGLASQITLMTQAWPIQFRDAANVGRSSPLDVMQCARPNYRASDLAANPYRTRAKKIVLLIGTNDVGTTGLVINGGDPTTCYTNITSTLNAWRAADPTCQVAILTVPARADSGAIAGAQNNIDTLNGLIRANSAGFDLVIDLAALTAFSTGNTSNALVANIYASDHLHFVANGHTTIAAKVQNDLTAAGWI